MRSAHPQDGASGQRTASPRRRARLTALDPLAGVWDVLHPSFRKVSLGKPTRRAVAARKHAAPRTPPTGVRHGLLATRAALFAGRARAAYLPRNTRVSLPQAPPGLCHQAERGGRERTAASPASPWKISSVSQSGGIFNLAAQTWNHTFYWGSLQARVAVASPAAPSRTPSTRLSVASATSKSSSPRLLVAISAPVGPGWSRTRAATWLSSTPTTPAAHSPATRRRSSPATCGSTRITSTIGTRDPSTSRRGGTS